MDKCAWKMELWIMYKEQDRHSNYTTEKIPIGITQSPVIPTYQQLYTIAIIHVEDTHFVESTICNNSCIY